MRAITITNIVAWGIVIELFWLDPNRNTQRCDHGFPGAIICSRHIFHFALCALLVAICAYIVGRRPRYRKAALMCQRVLLFLFIACLAVGIVLAPGFGNV
jgi:hypothetical protein